MSSGSVQLARDMPGVVIGAGLSAFWTSLEASTTVPTEDIPITRSLALALPDDVLMQRIAEGDPSAYRSLSERHLAAILRYCTRMLGDPSEAEDVTQETFLRLWQHAGRYEARGGRPTTWLYRIAHNLCVDRMRRRRPADDSALERQASSDRPSGLLLRKRIAVEVQAALAALPERQRAALVLCHYEGLSNPEAAAVLGCGLHALESLLARARGSLRLELAQLHEQAKEPMP